MQVWQLPGNDPWSMSSLGVSRSTRRRAWNDGFYEELDGVLENIHATLEDALAEA